MLGDELLELADERLVAAELEVGADPILQRTGAQVLQPRDVRLRELLVTQVGERGAAPERERLVEPPRRERVIAGRERLASAFDGSLEALCIQLTGRDAQLVAGGAREQQATLLACRELRLENPAQPRDGNLKRLGGGLGAIVAPQLGEQPLAWYHLVGVQEKQREQRPLPRAADGDAPIAVVHLQRSEDLEVHRGFAPTVTRAVTAP